MRGQRVTVETLQLLPTDSVHPGTNDRTTFKQSELRELADSIAEHGLAQPILVRPAPTGGYELIAGERRWRAHQLLGLEQIPAIVRDLDDLAAAAIMLAENMMRKDLSPLEEARAYESRAARFKLTVPQIAIAAKVSETRVRNRLRLLQLVPEAQELVASGNLSLNLADALVELDVNRQRIALRSLQAAKSPTIGWFRGVCSTLLVDQAQSTFLDMADLMQLHPQPVDFGPVALTFPRAGHLPAMEGAQSTGEALQAYIAGLLQAGLTAEAAVVGSVYEGLIRCNCARPPRNTS